jgi:cob(I)alamin adenosyltransferase
VEQDWILSRSKHIPEHVEAMTVALATEMDKLEEVLQAGAHDLVIVDEINYCIHRNLIPVERALKLAQARPPQVELVFTGRYAHESLMELADVVTEMRKIKHHFDKGVSARRGIEF